jgi:hypothetical protein
MKSPVLFEDATMYYNKWVQGIASGDLASQKVGLKELLNKNDEYMEQNPNLTKAEPVMPYPVPNAVSVLGELITSTSNALGLFRLALKQPVLKDKKAARAEIITVINHLKKSMNVLNSLIAQLQTKQVDKS